MEAKTKRTLVKSAPELWELADDLERMEAWMGGLVGASAPIPVKVTDREPQRILAWRAHGEEAPREGARIAIELVEGGLGTSVSVTAQHATAEPAAASAALEQVLDELASPERRPFARG